ncbi:SRPBCC family protein [Gordonia sp. Z-3]|uniref:SRPBCC family protein n=1 Tax=Gordonia sp. Z-3 TaxID=3115408 RepID=UPI002E2E4513|nr:SRPBCC family protein [Gordonia sp. Z-3]MED5802759.1 SRPBCC family protein [Gordonia sp. Z-3]
MAQHSVTSVDRGPHTVSRQVIVHASAAEVFALVADPHRHPQLDGSGTVRDTPVTGPDRLGPGARFSVGMKQYGVPYKITSTVTSFTEDELVEWQHPMGHRWRWEFEAVSPSQTRVTETFDYSTIKVPKIIDLLGYDKKNGAGIEGTLSALAARWPG